jgi:peptidoglycan/xylan/chitin deacetylase (PgdA/CDA1 family)
MAKRKITVTTSWDDGNPLDFKVAELLKQYGLRGIFYIPGVSSLSDDEIRLLAEYGEIGGHTVHHYMDLKQLSDSDLDYEIGENKRQLERIIDGPVTSFCYPRGRFDERVIMAVQRAGYQDARTTRVLAIDSANVFRTDTSVHVFPRSEYGQREWEDVAKELADRAATHGGVFHLWGHAAELERLGYWSRLEDFFKWLTAEFEVIS